eukprot:m.44249 g.44249  ORF g.44249 m.44249 type:complete len:380 (+) comp10073_c0_seq3:297-1436(+)
MAAAQVEAGYGLIASVTNTQMVKPMASKSRKRSRRSSSPSEVAQVYSNESEDCNGQSDSSPGPSALDSNHQGMRKRLRTDENNDVENQEPENKPGDAPHTNQSGLAIFGTLYNLLLRPQLVSTAGIRNLINGWLPWDQANQDLKTGNETNYSMAFENTFNPWAFIRNIPPLSEAEKQRPPALPLKTKSSKEYTLVLDLDETLVHCSVEEQQEYDFKFPVSLGMSTVEVFARLRPHMLEFLERVSQKYEVVLFTASQKVYANELVKLFDPTRSLIKHRLFREHCVHVEGNYVKNLGILGRDLSKVLLVDNSPQAYAYQVDNGVPIVSWFEDKSDNELMQLLPFLDELADNKVEDVRPHVLQQFKQDELVQQAPLWTRTPP